VDFKSEKAKVEIFSKYEKGTKKRGL